MTFRMEGGHRGIRFGHEVGQLSARTGVAAYALDPEAAARLWPVSLEMLAG